MKRAAVVCVLSLVCAVSLGGQVFEPRPRHFADQLVWTAGVFGGIPLGDFRKHEDGGAGVELMLGLQPWRRQPVIIRTQLSWLLYGTVQGTGNRDVCDLFGCQTETFKYDARNHIMASLQAGPEYFATDGRVRPFTYALFGVTWFDSWTNVQPTSPGTPTVGSLNLFSSHNVSTAFGAGVRFVGSKFGRQLGLELAAGVNRNVRAKYLTEGGVRIDSASNTWYVTPTQSAAHVLGFHLSFYIGPYINWNDRRPR